MLDDHRDNKQTEEREGARKKETGKSRSPLPAPGLPSPPGVPIPESNEKPGRKAEVRFRVSAPPHRAGQRSVGLALKRGSDLITGTNFSMDFCIRVAHFDLSLPVWKQTNKQNKKTKQQQQKERDRT